MTTKVCSKCGRELPVENFFKKASSKDGYQFYCKDCTREALAKRYAEKKVKQTKTEEAEAKEAIAHVMGLKSFSVNQLVAELKGRGKKVLVDPTPRDAMELLRDAGFKGQLQYVKIETIDLNRI